jgi:hypothetical protein
MQIIETAQTNSVLLIFSDTVDPYKVSLIMRTSSPKWIQLADPFAHLIVHKLLVSQAKSLLGKK